MTPGSTKKNTGQIFRNAQKSGPNRACFSFLAASTRWTMVWSQHQYQMPRTGYPSRTEYQGRPLGSFAPRAICRKLPVPHVTLLPGTAISGCGLFASVWANADHPPAWM